MTWEEKIERLAERLGVHPLPDGHEDMGIVLKMPNGLQFSAIELALALLDRMDEAA